MSINPWGGLAEGMAISREQCCLLLLYPRNATFLYPTSRWPTNKDKQYTNLVKRNTVQYSSSPSSSIRNTRLDRSLVETAVQILSPLLKLAREDFEGSRNTLNYLISDFEDFAKGIYQACLLVS